MKVYFDTSVVNVFLFGEEREKERYRSVMKVFDTLNEGKMEGLISMYTLQEIHAFCQLEGLSRIGARRHSGRFK